MGEDGRVGRGMKMKDMEGDRSICGRDKDGEVRREEISILIAPLKCTTLNIVRIPRYDLRGRSVLIVKPIINKTICGKSEVVKR